MKFSRNKRRKTKEEFKQFKYLPMVPEDHL